MNRSSRFVHRFAALGCVSACLCVTLSGCFLLHSDKPHRGGISEEDTAQTTDRFVAVNTTAPTTTTAAPENAHVALIPTAATTTTTTKATRPTNKAPSSYFTTPVDYRVVSSDGYVNGRRGPSTSYEVFSSIRKGEVITALAQEGDWIYYKAPEGPNGWIHLSGLTPIVEQYWQAIMPTDEQQLPSEIDKTVVADDGANMRVGPDAEDYAVLTNVPKGRLVTITARQGDWYFCYFAQACGWVHKSNLS